MRNFSQQTPRLKRGPSLVHLWLNMSLRVCGEAPGRKEVIPSCLISHNRCCLDAGSSRSLKSSQRFPYTDHLLLDSILWWCLLARRLGFSVCCPIDISFDAELDVTQVFIELHCGVADTPRHKPRESHSAGATLHHFQCHEEASPQVSRGTLWFRAFRPTD